MSDESIDNKNSIDKSHESHEYDGIKELNNPAPLWVYFLFFITIGFSGIYAVKYFGHPKNGMDQSSEYTASIEAQKKIMRSKSGSGANFSDNQKIEAGEKLFKSKGCIACHGLKGEGNSIGPNLSDNFWLYGCHRDSVFHTISEGRPEKGMSPFKSNLSETQIDQICAFILKSLVGSNPPNGKAPQGTECK